MVKLVSFDISSDFGFFKKPDINEFYLTYNLPPKPVILGIIGSILGMTGLGKQYDDNLYVKKILDIGDALTKDSKKTKSLVEQLDLDIVQNQLENLEFKKRERLLELLKLLKNSKEISWINDELKEIVIDLKSELLYPEYYKQLKHLYIGIKPSQGFPFNKIMNKYNTYFAGYNFPASQVNEQLLIRPRYRIYVYDETEKILGKLVMRLENKNPLFMPYLGKNEFIANFDNLKVMTDFKPIQKSQKTHVFNVFLRSKNMEKKNKGGIWENPLKGSTTVVGLPAGFVFLENYPIGYSNNGVHYEHQMAEFTAHSVETSQIDMEKGKLFEINKEVIYLS